MNISDVINKKYKAFSGAVNVRVHNISDNSQTITVYAKSAHNAGKTYCEEYLCDLMGEVKACTDVRVIDKPFVQLGRKAQPTIQHQTWGYWNKNA